MKTEAEYTQQARPDCPACGGKGMLCYYWDQDDAKIAPCPECFADDAWAKATAERWDKHLHETGR